MKPRLRHAAYLDDIAKDRPSIKIRKSDIVVGILVILLCLFLMGVAGGIESNNEPVVHASAGAR